MVWGFLSCWMGEISGQPYLLEKLGLFWAPRVTASSSSAISASTYWHGLSWECLAVPWAAASCVPVLECAVLSGCSRVRLHVTPWTVAHRLPLSMEFSRQEDWSGLPFHSPGDLPNPGIKPASHTSPALADRFLILNERYNDLSLPKVQFLILKTDKEKN